MEYQRIRQAEFLERPNRFIAYCQVEGQPVTAHVKNTGRCQELLLPGAVVYLEYANNPARRTPCDLVAVQKGQRLINMDSQAPNQVFQEALAEGKVTLPGQPAPLTLIRREKSYEDSRFDIYVEATGGWRAFIEIKGVTLEEAGVVRFPDAPTERGVKHLQALMRAQTEGYAAYVVFVIQMADVRYFTPHRQRHPAFAQTLRQAAAAGVGVLAYDCKVTPTSLAIHRPVAVQL